MSDETGLQIGDVTAPDPEGEPPYPVHPNVAALVLNGDVAVEFLDMFYEGYLVYDEESDSVIITHKGRAYVEELAKKGFK